MRNRRGLLDAARVRFDVTGEDESDDHGDGIDMGVDYDGEGEIDAIGDAYITFAGTGIGGGWVCSTPTNGGVAYTLDDGPDQGKWVAVAEDVIPRVKLCAILSW